MIVFLKFLFLLSFVVGVISTTVFPMISRVIFVGVSTIIISIFFRFHVKHFYKNNILFLLIERIIVSRETIVIVNQNRLLN